MRNQLMKSMDLNTELNMMYLSKCGEISKRRVKVIQVGEGSFRAYCYLRGAKRTFTIDNVLALVPVVNKESRVI